MCEISMLIKLGYQTGEKSELTLSERERITTWAYFTLAEYRLGTCSCGRLFLGTVRGSCS